MRAFSRSVAACLIAALASATIAGCSSIQNEYAGRVVDDTTVLRVPVLPMPSVSLDAGFAPGSVDGLGQGGAAATVAGITGVGNVAPVASVSVQPGDRVRLGQEIARLDASALDANGAIAKADLSAMRAQVGVLDDALHTVASNRSALDSKRRQIDDTAALLASTRIGLATKLAGLKALLAAIEATGAGEGSPALSAGTASMIASASPPGAMPDPATIRAGIARLTAALAEIDAGLAKIRSGRAQLSSAGAKLNDARTRLRDLRRLTLAGVDGAGVGVQIAEYQCELAVLRSPVDGVVVSVVSVGEVLAPGATVAEVRRDGPPRVTTWVAPEDLGAVAVGSRVEVRADWFPVGSGDRSVAGRVTMISTRMEYPPTSFATSEIHLTRAIRLEVTLADSAGQLAMPPGAQVDVRFLSKQ